MTIKVCVGSSCHLHTALAVNATLAWHGAEGWSEGSYSKYIIFLQIPLST